MCKTCQSTLYTPCNHLVDGPLRPSLFCLFGHLCSEAGHVDRVLSVSEDKENCPRCADPRLGAEGAEFHSPASKNNMLSGARKSAMQAIILENLEVELRDINIPLEKCKSLLRYILGLPEYIDCDRLVACFGHNASGRYADHNEAELLDFARGEGCDGKLKVALREGRVLRNLDREKAGQAAGR